VPGIRLWMQIDTILDKMKRGLKRPLFLALDFLILA